LQFDQPFGLDANGEIFLRTAGGEFLTPLRSAPVTVIGAAREIGRSCGIGSNVWLDDDYRGVATIHGLHEVSAFSQPTCVDAHVAHAEALEPAHTLLNDLLTRAALFAGVGALLVLIASRWMSAPVRRLAQSARALEAGDFDRPIPTGGPSEVRELARSFAAMARALGDQMAREQRARLEAESANR